jgi:signal transduction histidine kinase
VVAGVAIFHDVTAERRMLAERERLDAALEVERARPRPTCSSRRRRSSAWCAVRARVRDGQRGVPPAGRLPRRGGPVRVDALPEVREQGFIEVLDRVLATGEPYAGTDVPIHLQRARGGPLERRYVSFVYQPLTEADGTRSGVFAHGVDVTDQVVARAEVERARADAEAARRRAEEANKAKSEFLAAMSHELRTPLNAIGGYAELMELGRARPGQRRAAADLARIRRSQRHLLTLITDILNFARLEGGRVEYDLRPVALADLIADVAPMIEPQLAAQQLAYDVRLAGGGDATARADQDKVRQILVNLLSNAAKFTPAGGRVTVAVEAPPGPSVFVRVADTGIGIPADKLEAIFDPFVQVQSGLTRRHEGTGLGLAISRDLARGMGGDLTAESAPTREARSPSRCRAPDAGGRSRAYGAGRLEQTAAALPCPARHGAADQHGGARMSMAFLRGRRGGEMPPPQLRASPRGRPRLRPDRRPRAARGGARRRDPARRARHRLLLGRAGAAAARRGAARRGGAGRRRPARAARPPLPAVTAGRVR